MSESLGDALLTLRTDDAQFNAGVTRAEGRAQRLGNTLDKTSGSSAKLAGEMAKAGRSAETMGQGFQRGGQQVVASAGAQRAGMQQLGAQIGDIATMYSLGARPTQIFASQIGQVTQAIQLASGGTSRFAAFLGGPWGIAISAGTVVLAPFVAKLFEAEEGMQAVEFASDRMGDAQSILGNVIDLTTGKIKTQSTALIALARAQLALGRIESMRNQATARRSINDIRRGEIQLQAGMGGGVRLARVGDGTEDIVDRFQRGVNTSAQAELQLRNRLDVGRITEEAYARAAQAVTSFALETENIKLFDDALKGLNGDQGALAQFLEPDKERARRGRKRSGPDQEEIDARFEGQLVGITQQILSARLQLATSAEERAELEARIVEWDRRQSIAEVQADKQLDAAQKSELEAALNRRADAEMEVIERNKRIELERDAQALADTEYELRNEALQLEYALADTEAERKDIALKILAAEQAYLLSKLQAVVLSDTANEAEKKYAQARINALLANSDAKLQTVLQANETSTDRFVRDLNKTPAQLNEAIDKIKVDGLEAFNDELVDAIVNFRSLGDVARSVLKQILADLLRLQIQQAIIGPLSSMLGLGGASPNAALLPSVNATIGNPAFAGIFGDGGTIARGQWGIVGERGPEAVFATPQGVGVLPNSALRAMPAARGGDVTVHQTNILPERADPRRTGSSIARANERSIRRVAGKGLASGRER